MRHPHPHLKNPNHLSPSKRLFPSKTSIPFKNPTSKIKALKILNLCGFLNHFINHLLSKHLHCFLHHHPIKSFNVYHGVCKHWSWFPFILKHSHMPPSPHPSSIILQIFPITFLWSMLLHKPFIHPSLHEPSIIHIIIYYPPNPSPIHAIPYQHL